MNILFVDLRAQHQGLQRELQAVFARALERSSFILGPEVQRFAVLELPQWLTTELSKKGR